MGDDPRQSLARGLEALGRRDMARAAELLRQAAAGLPREAMNWLALCNAEIAVDQPAAAEAALDQQLALAPQDFTALLLKGLLREQAGDQVAATSFYRAASALADNGARPPAGFDKLLAHGRDFVAASSQRFATSLEDRLGPGLSPTMQEAVDLLAGRRQLYFQEPTVFYYPGLPQTRFYDPTQFPWFAPMLELVPQMQAELAAVLAEGAAGFAPYLYRNPNRPAVESHLVDNPEWTAFHFWQDGELNAENAARCPATMKALSHVPLVEIAGRCPNAHWSRLLPGAHITPHVGMLNTRLICHIPILTAPHCWLRVGSERREWIDGVPLVFDDSIEHEAKNDGGQERVILLFEIWRPEVDEADRAAIGRIFEAIGDFS